MTQTIRPDVDIEEDVRAVIAHYPPLQADRHQLRVTVRSGEVIIEGHVRSLVSRRYLLDHIREVPGVSSVDTSRLFCEETIRLEAGQHVSGGVIANAAYGVVVLTGKLPDGMSAEKVVADVAQIPGVVRVVTKF
jgi:osmotically-inducible protein OsmY